MLADLHVPVVAVLCTRAAVRGARARRGDPEKIASGGGGASSAAAARGCVLVGRPMSCG